MRLKSTPLLFDLKLAAMARLSRVGLAGSAHAGWGSVQRDLGEPVDLVEIG